MRFWQLFMAIPLLASCVSHATLFNGIDEKKISCEKLSGSYENDPDEISGPLAFRLSSMEQRKKEPTIYPAADKVQLSYDGTEQLSVSVFCKDSMLGQFSLKAKNKGNYIEIKRRLRLVPIPILFWYHDEKRCLLMNDEAGNLIVSHGDFQAIFFLSMARSNSRHGVADFQRSTE